MVLIGLEAATHYIVKITECLSKLIVQVAVAEAEKKPWTYACGSSQEINRWNTETTRETSNDQEI